MELKKAISRGSCQEETTSYGVLRGCCHFENRRHDEDTIGVILWETS